MTKNPPSTLSSFKLRSRSFARITRSFSAFLASLSCLVSFLGSVFDSKSPSTARNASCLFRLRVEYKMLGLSVGDCGKLLVESATVGETGCRKLLALERE